MPCLNSQLRKFQNYILYIRNKHTLQLKQISLIKNSDISMYDKTHNEIVLLWQPSWMSYVSRHSYKLFTNNKVTL